jgi:hypothetical protein
MIRDWIVGFLLRHRARLAPPDWPAASAAEEWLEFIKGWVTALALKEVTEAEADLASQRLAANPPNWRREHIPAVLAGVEAIRKEQGSPAAVATNREGAEAASRACERCGGGGLATVWHPLPDDTTQSPRTTAAYCVCQAGRWVENVHRTAYPEVRKRFVDLADVLAGRSAWLVDEPGAPPLCRTGPAPGSNQGV